MSHYSFQRFSICIEEEEEDNDNDNAGGDQHKWQCGTGERRSHAGYDNNNNECKLQPESVQECGQQQCGRGRHTKR